MAGVILLVDDDDSLQLLIPRAVEKANVQISFNFAADGDETMKYLGGKGPYSNRRKYPFPDLMLLDLKMPRVGGFEVLEWKLPMIDDLRLLWPEKARIKPWVEISRQRE